LPWLDREAFELAKIFVREALYSRFGETVSEKSAVSRIFGSILPGIEDDVLTHNVKWFLTGMLSGLMLSLWIPFMMYVSALVSVYLVNLTVASSLVMMMLVSVLISVDLIHQVLAVIRDLVLLRKTEYLPVDYGVIERAASYSLMVGGGLALISGMGLGIGFVVYAFTSSLYALLAIPLGFTTSFLLVYSIVVYVFSKFRSKLPPLLSTLIYVAIIVVALSSYLTALSTGSWNEMLSFLSSFRAVYPITFVYLAVVESEPVTLTACIAYALVAAILALTIPSRYGLKPYIGESATGNRGFILRFKRLTTLSFKDILVLSRDPSRLKQFYGSIVALTIPLALTLLNPRASFTFKILEFTRSITLASFTGVISYIAAVISVPLLAFLESDRSVLLYTLPVSCEEVVVSKTIASLALYSVVAATTSLLVAVFVSAVHGFVVFLAMILYWLLGSYLALELTLRLMWGRLVAWSEFSFGIARRILVTLVLLIAIGFHVVVGLIYYIVNPPLAFAVNIATPIPLAIYVIYRVVAGGGRSE